MWTVTARPQRPFPAEPISTAQRRCWAIPTRSSSAPAWRWRSSAPETNVQTTHVPAGGATVVEFKTEVPGTYSIVDHSLGRMEKGAAAQIVVLGEQNPDVFHVLKSGSGGAGGH